MINYSVRDISINKVRKLRRRGGMFHKPRLLNGVRDRVFTFITEPHTRCLSENRGVRETYRRGEMKNFYKVLACLVMTVSLIWGGTPITQAHFQVLIPSTDIVTAEGSRTVAFNIVDFLSFHSAVEINTMVNNTEVQRHAIGLSIFRDRR